MLEEMENACMHVLKPHVSLNVSNVDASVAFYEKVFAVAASKRRPGYAKFDLHTPSLNLTMQEAPRSGVNASHFGVQVASSASAACCAPSGLPSQDQPVQLGRKSGCC
jgi:catechol 2,3-dioxygenase-like lactoylglutathione lyase family enzyme